jgi:hypothetical protein
VGSFGRAIATLVANRITEDDCDTRFPIGALPLLARPS